MAMKRWLRLALVTGILSTTAVVVGALPASATEGFRVFFQTNNHVLAEYSSGNTVYTSTLGMTPNTNPNATLLTDGSYEVAFQANNHYLALDHFGGTSTTTHYGMDTATSPAITGLANGGWITAFQTNTHHLATYTSAGTIKDTGLPMQPATNPAIAALPNNTWAIAYQANTTELSTYSSTTSHSNTHAGLAPTTSPTIAGLADGSYELAAQTNTHHLLTAHVSGTSQSMNPTTLGMDPNTTPTIATQQNLTDWAIAFTANTDDLATYNNHGSTSDTHAGLAPTTSPAILALTDGSYELAAQTNTNHLLTAHVSGTGQTTNPTTLGMNPNTNPTIGTPTPVPGTTRKTASTNFDWAKVVLADGGWPVCANNVTVLTQWMASEEPPSDWYNRNNPLNNGDGSGGGAGLGSYDNLVTAAYYVGDNINANPSWYGAIDSDLTACAAPGTTAQAIWASPWAGSHYGNGSTWHSGSVDTVTAPAANWGPNPPSVPARPDTVDERQRRRATIRRRSALPAAL
jgi:hypothetical protein